jgi:hypothetical protein
MYVPMSALCLLVAWVLLPRDTVAADDGFSVARSITRLQMRHTIDASDIASFTFSSFLLAKNKTFLLGILDYQADEERHNSNGRLEVNLGRPFSDNPMGWVVRGKLYYHGGSVAAAGLQLNFNELAGLGPVLTQSRLTTFVQLLPNTSDPYFGDYEILHYYSFDIVPKHMAIRGYNVFNGGDKDGFVRNSWADLIYSLNDRIDVYYRINYVSQTNGYLGPRGTTQYLGLRINWY